MTVEEFAFQAPAIIAEMDRQRAIFQPDCVSGKSTATEMKDAASEKWDASCDQLKDLCAGLFRDVGGLPALEVFINTLANARQKHGIRRHILTDDSAFLVGILIRATSKEPLD